MDNELDELINKYTRDLIKLKDQWSQRGIETQHTSVSPPITITDESNEEPTKEEPEEEEPTDSTLPDLITESPQDTAVDPEEYDKPNISHAAEIPLADPENFAFFTANVFTGNQAYPVANAKISVYLDGKLHLFLITDDNGQTKTVKLESYPKLNSFIPESTQQTIDYSADIVADGFAERHGLLVSAVGGSDILLSAELTPLSERID